ncbi:MAG: NUDIX domain-containing protein [Candidatus Diapherotrites archaeon]|nr:NUDIX domain-containing protein [Candidatus Diapherotrites archaeon]
MAKQFPEAVVGPLIFDSKGKLFLMKSHKWKGHFVTPGGHIELGETAEEAVKREVKEETSLDVFDINFLCFQNVIFPKNFWKKKHFLSLRFTCKTKSEKVKLNDEAQEYAWVSTEEALKMDVEPHTLFAIREYLKKD